MLLEHRPLPPVAFYVESLWYCERYQAPHRYERVLPNGRFQLIADLSRRVSPIVVGMQSRSSLIDTSVIQSMIGVVFRPGGAIALLQVPSGDFFNRTIALEYVWGPAASGLRDRIAEARDPGEKFRLLEEALRERAEKPVELHASVRFALGKFLRQPHIRSVLQVTKDAGLSRRRFAQLFREQVGITPKLYCRLNRFQQVVRQIAAGQQVDWADVALAGGYCDQAHFVHEFRDFSGMSPSAYLASRRPFANHVAID